MSRIAWRDFSKGLWVAGGRDNVPDGALRRATGISQLAEGMARSMRGYRQLNAFGANQYQRFAGALFQGRLADVLRNGVVINAAFPQSGVVGLVADGPRLSFLRMPPQSTLDDWLFVAGGNNPFKVKADGTSASKWGIDAPPNGATATLSAPSKVQVDNCDATTGWSKIDTPGVAIAIDSTNFVEGTGSLKFAFTDPATTRYKKSVTVNLNTFGAGTPSADQDYIQLWIRLTGELANGPAAENYDWLEVAFSLGDTNFHDNVLTRRVDAVDGVIPLAGLADQAVGLATALESGSGIQTILEQSFITQTEQDIVNGVGVFNPASDTRRLLGALSQTQIMRQNDVWQRILLPKSSFDRTGSDATKSFADVQAIRLTHKRSGAVTVLIDDIALVGGAGMLGKYQYLFTFKNSATGSRSNSNPSPLEGVNVGRQKIMVGNLPVATDPQVDKVEAWRTVGNGEAFFKAWEVNNGTLTFEDDVADFPGLFTGKHLSPAELPEVLQALELPLDNDPPPSTIREVLGKPFLGRAWFIDPDNPQNLYYSPAGRPESVQGFVSVTTQTDEACKVPVRWNDVIYVLTTHGLYRIVGEDEPFVAQEVFAAPGTTQPDTVQPTPFGIAYVAPDGPRLFDGNFSSMLAFEGISPLFRGYATETINPFDAITGAYIREDYLIGDGMNLLICNLRTQAWRHVDLVCDTLYAADDDIELLAAVGFGLPGVTLSLEDEAADTATPFQIQTPSARISVDTKGIIQRVFIEIDSGGEQLAPVLVLDDVEVPLSALLTSSRQTVEWAVLRTSRLVAVRLSGTTKLSPIQLFGIEVDCHVPDGSGSQ